MAFLLPAFWGPTIPSPAAVLLPFPSQNHASQQAAGKGYRQGMSTHRALNRKVKMRIQTQNPIWNIEERNGKQREVPGMGAPRAQGAAGQGPAPNPAAPQGLAGSTHRCATLRSHGYFPALRDSPQAPGSSSSMSQKM